MRNGSVEYFTREQAKAAGWEIMDIMKIPSDEWEVLAELVHNWVYMHVQVGHPELVEIDYQLNIFYKVPEDANDIEEEDLPEEKPCQVPKGLYPFIPVGKLSV